MLNKRAPFNRLPFNRPSGVLGELNAAAAFYSHLNAAVGAGKVVPTELSGGVSLKNDIILTTGFTHPLPGEAALQNDAILTPAYTVSGTSGALLSSDLHIVKHVPLAATIGSNLQAYRTRIWLNLSGASSAGGVLKLSAGLAKNMPADAIIGGLLNAEIDVTPMDISTANIIAPIRAGDTVFFDTENFVLLINDKNALYAHVGDWPQVKRNTVRVEINNGTSTLTGKLLVTPRYL